MQGDIARFEGKAVAQAPAAYWMMQSFSIAILGMLLTLQ
jgi:hypothetical protein